MFIHTAPERDFTLLYFSKHDSYRHLFSCLEKYVEAGPTRDELYYFDPAFRLITPEQTKQLIPLAARAKSVRPPGSRTALLLERDTLYGLGRVYTVAENRILRRTWVTRLFRELQDAAQWLNLDDDFIMDIFRQHNECRLAANG